MCVCVCVCICYSNICVCYVARSDDLFEKRVGTELPRNIHVRDKRDLARCHGNNSMFQCNKTTYYDSS